MRVPILLEAASTGQSTARAKRLRRVGAVVVAGTLAAWLSLTGDDAAARPEAAMKAAVAVAEPDHPRTSESANPVDAEPAAAESEDNEREVAEPATKAARKLLALRDEIAASLTDTKYQHRTVIRRKDGVYRWDCSGMAAWMLNKAAPAARKALDKGRPVARDFARQIRRAPTKRARNGWQQIATIHGVKPGDLFAWERPPGFKSKNTGHVGFVLAPPEPSKKWRNAFTVRILDATSLLHDDDSRPEGGEGGFGEGTILFTTDRYGHGTAYGWFGDRSGGVITTPIYFGRVSR